MAIPSLHKRCKHCQQLKPLNRIKTHYVKRKDGRELIYDHICLDCHAAREAQRRAFKERPLCACGCGEQVKYPGATYRFGHQIRVEPKPNYYTAQSLTDGSDTPKKYEKADKRKYKKCTKCGEVKERTEFDTYKHTDFYGNVISRCYSKCIPCARAEVNGRRKLRTPEQRAYDARRNKEWMFRKTYGITVDEFEIIKRSQNDCCAICQKHCDRLFVDHCHQSGRVRGALCSNCNVGLGQFKEDESIVINLLKYIRSFVK